MSSIQQLYDLAKFVQSIFLHSRKLRESKTQTCTHNHTMKPPK